MKNLPPEDVTKLLNQIALGDNKAVEVIFRHYQSALFAFIRLRVRDDSAAEEILNDTFMIAFQKTAQYDGKSEFKTWLFGIAKNVCGTWIRKQNTGMARATIEIDEALFDNLPDPDWDVVSRLESQEMDEILRECIDSLPITHREAFFWTWFEELPMDLVAERLSCPVGTIKSRLFNARAKIADCVKNAFGEGTACVT
jgi:RNA polymerase sigma-70 factor (ECF subfamily)